MKLLDNEKLDEIATAIAQNAQELVLDVRFCKAIQFQKMAKGKKWVQIGVLFMQNDHKRQKRVEKEYQMCGGGQRIAAAFAPRGFWTFRVSSQSTEVFLMGR